MTDNPDLHEAIRAVVRPLVLNQQGGRWVVGEWPGSAFVPACRLEDLGDASFRADHRLRYAYVAGAMANGIGSVEIVEAMSRAGMLGFFGAAGLPLARIEAAIDRLARSLGDAPHGFNLIHSPTEPDLENGRRRSLPAPRRPARRGVGLPRPDAAASSATARTASTPTPPAASSRPTASSPRCRASRWRRSSSPRRRSGCCKSWCATGDLTAEQARLAARIPMAQDLTAEADSGGHTDNRPAGHAAADHAGAARPDAGAVPLRRPAAGRGGRRHRHAGVGRGGFRHGGGLRPDRLDQPGLRRIRLVRRGARDAGPGGAGRRQHGAGRRHVRDGRQGAGAEARHHVCHAGRQAV